jgi:mono/diheme cytochrome c family protein
VAQGTADADRTVATLPPTGADAAAAPAPAVPEEVAEGIRLYHAQYCGTCHTNTLAGTAGTFGPTHDGLRDTAAKRIHDQGYTGTATTAEAYVRESIRKPGAYRVPGFEHTRFLMPAYTQLTDAEVDALVRMLLWQPPSEEQRP